MPLRCHPLLAGTAIAAAAALALVGHGAEEPAIAELPEPRLYVDGAHAGCDDAQARAESPARPFCTVTRAAQVAQAGDEVLIAAGRYPGVVRPLRSGVRFVAAGPGVILDAAGAANAVRLIGTDDVELHGVEITGGASQGVWVEVAERVRLQAVTVRDNPGAGVQLKAARDTVIHASALRDNRRAGLLELTGSTGTRLTASTVTGNGRDGAAYNGDGVQLGGSGAVVADSTIAGNGDSQYEHGIYTAAGSSGWQLLRNAIDANAGAGIKASGTGTITSSRITGGRWGIVVSDNPEPVMVRENRIYGRAQHQVLVTTGTTPANVRLWQNSIAQTGRAAYPGDTSAVFVVAATRLELRNTLVAYTGSDAAGVSLWINDAARVGELVATTNWYAANDAQSRHLAWNGSRVTLAIWRSRTGQDARSLSSWSPQFDGQLRITSTNWGAGRGDPLPDSTTGVPVDIGA